MPATALSNDLERHVDKALPTQLAAGDEVDVLPRIFEDGITIAVMRRPPSAALQQSVLAQCQAGRAWQLSWLGPPAKRWVRTC